MSLDSAAAALQAVAGWTSDTVSDATEKQQERARKLKDAASAPKPKTVKPKQARNIKPKPAQEETSAQLRPVAPKRVINGQIRYCDAQSAARTANGFIPPRSVNYAAAARLHIHALLKTQAGKKIAHDASALMRDLIAKNIVPADYAHMPHVRYWQRQVLEQGK